MPIDHSIYMQQTTPDIMGGIQRGMEMRDRRDDREQQAKSQKLVDMKNKIDLTAKLLGGVTDQESWARGVAEAEKLGLVEPGKMPSIYSKQLVDGFNQKTLTAQERINNQFKQQGLDLQKQGMDLKRQELAQKSNNKNSPEYKLSKLSGTDKARFDNAKMVLNSLDGMAKALDAGDNTFSMIGDNDYTRNARTATEAYGRMQSGGAINKDEEKRFSDTLPTARDSADIQRKKILAQRAEMLSRLKTLGFSPEDIGYKPAEFKYGLNSGPKNKASNVSNYGFSDEALDQMDDAQLDAIINNLGGR